MQIKGIIKFHVIGDDNGLPRWNAIVLQNLINLFFQYGHFVTTNVGALLSYFGLKIPFWSVL